MCETSSTYHLECAPHCGKLMPIVDPKDTLVLVNPLGTWDGLVPVGGGCVALLHHAEDVT